MIDWREPGMDTPLNLMLGARPDERFHLQGQEPRVKWITRFGPYRKVEWTSLFEPNGLPGTFTSVTIRLGATDLNGKFRCLQSYWGSVKCDATRTAMLHAGQLGGAMAQRASYVMTTTPKELWAARLHQADEIPVWQNMGGS